jgi:hypothetical protein
MGQKYEEGVEVRSLEIRSQWTTNREELGRTIKCLVNGKLVLIFAAA